VVRPAGFEPSYGGFRLRLNLLLGQNPEGTIKKAGCNFFKATPALFIMVRPAGFESSYGGFR
jgi:hypothetical protein